MNAQQLRNSILQEAIQGRLVPQDPNDEPASVLLERIREEKKRLVKTGKLKKKDLEETPISEDEIPFAIPDSWKWVRLSSYLDVRDGTHDSPKYYSDGIPFVTSKNLDNGRIDFSSCKLISEEDHRKFNERSYVEDGDILFAMIGSIGNPVIVQKDREFSIKNVALFKRYSKKDTNIQYIYYYLLFIQNELKKISSGGVQSFVGLKTFREWLFPLPPLAEQKRIVTKIEELLPKVEEYGKAQESLDKLNEELPERLKKSVLQEAISGKLVPQDPNDEPASVLLARIRKEKERLVKEGKLKKKDLEVNPISEDEIPFDIPDTWEWCFLEQITYPVGNKSNQIQSKDILEKGIIPVVSQGQNLIDGYTNDISRTISDLPLIMFGDHTRNVKHIDFEFVIGADGTKFFKPILINSKYLYHLITYIASGLRDRGYARHYSLLKIAYLPIPPLDEQHRIVAKIEELLDEIDKLKS